ncbi:UDP-forming cellulose synthase catalytic subunit [Roseomonas sp. M0104]|uniref:Cellulose synthase catalytic subunit [UDP-forming] n=1 Tax=Teichococcus coralli TaxID=2545983 RepID=A0A845B825_9PROT|nr:UDP-forming cellulose synthase catalytic subunit [Pseudoroseomonas coralli]MXP62256.1 UDP-forming cellulose synthase catalytic subunit [Pseudoroseomonas coralli]
MIGLLHRMVRRWTALNVLLAAVGVLLGTIFIVAPLEAMQQAWLALGSFLIFLIVARMPGRGAMFFLVGLSSLVSLRYVYWRITETLDYSGFFSTFFGTGLLLAELYAVIALLLSYFQQLWPLDRKPVPMPDDPDQWPVVDVFIPTYNEPLEVVKPSVFGALSMDWPRDKMNVYILDDGRREDFRKFAEEIGCGYMIRPDNKGAKAGNINHATTKTNGEYIVIFDCDHVATRGFLQFTIGWMLRDRGIGMLQTPHHFYSPDPFERNLASGKRVPNEGLLFYGLVQQGNDLWNATFFCGSCAVLRRTALEQVGGVPTQTVTEDCHCSLKMQRLGWRTAYLRVPLAAGLATDRLISHIGQRMRWARGMIQIFRVENPLLGPGLKLYQRLCYLNAQWHFLFPLPRFVFLTAPLAFLLLGQNLIAASPLAIAAFAGPHIIHSVATNSRLQGSVRHSFWSEIYETVLSLYLLPVVLTTLFDPKKGKFNVTDKGGTLDEGYFDMRAVGPNFALAVFLMLGLLSGIYGMAANPPSSLEFQANALNAIWVVLSLMTVMAGLAVGRERRQVRERHRISARLPVTVALPDGRQVDGESIDVSLGGVALMLSEPLDLPPETPTMLAFRISDEQVVLPAEILRSQNQRMHVRFTPQGVLDEGNIVRVVLGRADAWIDWDNVRPDRPMRALLEVVVSIGGLFRGDSQFSLRKRAERRARRQAAAAAAKAAPSPAGPGAASPSTVAALPVQPAREGGQEGKVRRAAAVLLLICAGLALPGAAWAQRPQAPLPPPPLSRSPLPDAGTPRVPGWAPLPNAAPELPGLAPLPGGPAAAMRPAGPALPDEAAAAAGTARVETRTLRQLGLSGPMQLHGVSDLQGVLFGIRSDEVVTGGKLVLQGATSPALIPELSQIAVTLNEQFIGTITPDRARPSFGPIEFPVNPVFFTEANRLNFRFTGRYAAECNDPLSGLLWSTISELSTLQLTVEKLPLSRDLARLPEPFFDRRLRNQRLMLPVVLPDGAGTDLVRAAAIATSWFAVQADYRGAVFPVSTSVPLRGDAMVLVAGSETVPGLALPRMEGPTLAVVPNPSDPESLLLVVGGRSSAEAAVAAQALAVGKHALSGEIALVQQPEMPARVPYDAPRWIRDDRPVRFGELVDPSELQSFGFAPGAISIPFRTAPDLYTWRDRPLPVDVKFRAPPGPVVDVAVSRLDATLNNHYLKSFPLRETEPSWPWSWVARQTGLGAVPDRAAGQVGLPPYLVFGQNELQLRFDMRPLNRGDCTAIPGDVRASVDPDSTIDLSRAYHFAELPNLAYFAGAGFPFTRMADFSGTAAVLPERANTLELSSFLTLIGKMAAIVGSPATGIQVVRPSAMEQVADRDLLVVGAVGRQPALTTLLGRDGPLRVEGNRVAVALPDMLENFRNLFLSDDRRLQRQQLEAVLTAPGEGTGMLIGFESPLKSHRSVVALTGTNPQGMEAMVNALGDSKQLSQIQGDLVMVSGGRLSAFKIKPNYTVGNLPLHLWPQYWLGKRPDLLLLLAAMAAICIAVPTYWALRRRAALRLRTRTQ